jgi:hypothetical protein
MGTTLETSSLRDLISRNIPTVRNIVESLARRSPRFEFIKESLDEFLHENGEFLELEPRVSSTLHSRSVATAHDDRSTIEIDHVDQISVDFIDILNSAIYQIMDVFDVEITLEQVQEAGYKLPEARITILEALHKMSQGLLPQPEKLIPIESPASILVNECEYQYPNRLTSSNIRILHILPGQWGSIVECELEERSLDNQGVEEVLSYVWGEPVFDKVIWIDGRSFGVTENLYSILCNLRRCDATRVIWIDAICINQSDLEEKTHQVRLMRDIFSKAQNTVIWLGCRATPWEMLWHPDPASDFKLAHQLGRYRFHAILEELLKIGTNGDWKDWDEDRFELSALLIFCMTEIMADQWWERAWTVQEATLPPNEPMIYFEDVAFPYTALISALDLISSMPPQDDVYRHVWKEHSKLCRYHHRRESPPSLG